MRVTVSRVVYRDDGTFGVLLLNDKPIAVTLERPWRDNRKGESCIPTGKYVCVRVKSPKFGNTWMVQNVPNRSEILFHAGNTFVDSHGCILVGEKFTVWADGSTSISDSRAGMMEFLDLTKDFVTLDLVVKDCA